MTFYYKTTTLSSTKPDAEAVKYWEHASKKKNWRIVQLENGYYQTECKNPDNKNEWVDVTRRETIKGAEAAIDASVEHFAKRLEFANGPKVVKTFK